MIDPIPDPLRLPLDGTRPLRAVDPETGEIADGCPHCRAKDREIEGLQEAHRSAMAKVRALRDDRMRNAEEHELWGLAIALFMEWRIATGHMAAKWTADRFWICESFLRPEPAGYGFNNCRLAVWGLAVNCFERQVTPTYTKRYDEFWRVFGPSAGVQSADHFEGWVNAGAAVLGEPPTPPLA